MELAKEMFMRARILISLMFLVFMLGGCPITPKIQVPELVGEDLDMARAVIAQAGLEIGIITWAYSSTSIAGIVLNQEPVAGYAVDPRSVIDLLVSKGPQPIPVPNLTGISQSEAIDTIVGVGLQVGSISHAYNELIGEGYTIDQNPSSGVLVAPNTSVNLIISLGPENEGEGEDEGEGEGEGEDNTDPVEMISVPEGLFVMGNSGAGDDATFGTFPEFPAHKVRLSAYEIGKYAVTNREFAAMLNFALANGYLTDSVGADYDGYTVYAAGKPIINMDVYTQIAFIEDVFSPITREGVPKGTISSMSNYPVINVTWYGAALYCNWLSEFQGLIPCYDTQTWICEFTANGYHLPSEAQWERAAAWDSVQERHWIYGFSSDTLVSKNRCNYYDNDPNYVNPSGFASAPYTSPVGWFDGFNVNAMDALLTVNSPSPAGCYDMSGNVLEWCNDWLDAAYYWACKIQGTVDNPMGPNASPYSFRVYRGGCWMYYGKDCRSALRAGIFSDYGSYHIGFRLSRY